MYLNIVVIVTYFVAHVTLSLLINDFILYVAIVKRIVLIVVNAPYKSPIIIVVELRHGNEFELKIFASAQ